MQAWGIIILLMAVLGYGGKTYYDNAEETIETLQLSKVALELVVKNSSNTIDNLKGDIEEQQVLNAALDVKLKAADDYQEDLYRILRTHDLTKLAAAKPGLIETRINDGTERVFENLQLITR